ncbi:ATP-grasp fold amidoligase family protein [Dankookia sp. GCM10030260]|uniref:ATP-grasp fold amidoligase family protein n=1 Tax=Dankookia sp. GCM10030260 TaxID=3273390 RepID=UPI00361C6499
MTAPAAIGDPFGALRGLLPASGRQAVRRLLRRAVDAVPPLARARDARALRRRMRTALGYEPDLRRPPTYTERLAHRILHDRDPPLVVTSDKVAVRDYVAARNGQDYLAPLLGAWDRAEAIAWDRLPDRFVLKANNGSGTNLIMRDKAALDRAAATREAARRQEGNHALWTGEWAYGRIRPRLLAEALLEGPGDDAAPVDYKFHLFGGRPRILEVALGRFTDHHRHLLRDAESFRPLPFRWGARAATRDEEAAFVPPPEVHAMARLAVRLGAPFAQVRVDFYLCAGRIRFGELTHYAGNACDAFVPGRYDRVLGDIWAAPERSWSG